LDNPDLPPDFPVWARWLKERRLETPAILALESLKPLHNLVYQLLVFSSPLVETVGFDCRAGVQLWDDPQNIEGLIRHLESQDHIPSGDHIR
jgi:hypothetical protein